MQGCGGGLDGLPVGLQRIWRVHLGVGYLLGRVRVFLFVLCDGWGRAYIQVEGLRAGKRESIGIK
jgi:hypothetical protein